MNKNIGWAEAINQEKIRWIDRYVDFTKNLKILDLGAGAGWYSKYFADRGVKVISIDHSPLFEDERIEIKIADIEKSLPLNDNEFDVVLAWDIIEHVENDKYLLSEIYRVSKSSSIIFVSVPHADDSRIASSYLTYCHYKDKTHKREYTPQILINDFKSSGFEKLELKLHGGQGYPYVILNFIDSNLIRFLMKAVVRLLFFTKNINIGNCHGDIFSVFKKG